MAEREQDTLDTFVDSSWYFYRYLDADNHNEMFSKDLIQPVDVYIGGVEHSVMHLLYARFICKVLGDADLLPPSFKEEKEPFKELITQGMVLNETFKDENGVYYPRRDVFKDGQVWKTLDGICVEKRIEKMSKSKLNGVDPTVLL